MSLKDDLIALTEKAIASQPTTVAHHPEQYLPQIKERMEAAAKTGQGIVNIEYTTLGIDGHLSEVESKFWTDYFQKTHEIPFVVANKFSITLCWRTAY